LYVTRFCAVLALAAGLGVMVIAAGPDNDDALQRTVSEPQCGH
jgi:hypothetical protein